MEHFYQNVRGLGNVAVSRHAQERMERKGVTPKLFEKVLLSLASKDVPDGQDVVFREGDGLRIVILTNPHPNRGAKLVKTVYRIGGRASSGH